MTTFKRLVQQCMLFVGQSSPMTDRQIDIIKSTEYAKGAHREREEILRMIWDAVETASSEQQRAMAEAIFYRIQDRN